MPFSLSSVCHPSTHARDDSLDDRWMTSWCLAFRLSGTTIPSVFHDLTREQKRALREAAQLARDRDTTMAQEDRDVHSSAGARDSVPKTAAPDCGRAVASQRRAVDPSAASVMLNRRHDRSEFAAALNDKRLQSLRDHPRHSRIRGAGLGRCAKSEGSLLGGTYCGTRCGRGVPHR